MRMLANFKSLWTIFWEWRSSRTEIRLKAKFLQKVSGKISSLEKEYIFWHEKFRGLPSHRTKKQCTSSLYPWSRSRIWWCFCAGFSSAFKFSFARLQNSSLQAKYVMRMVLHFLDGEDLGGFSMAGFVDGGEGARSNFVNQLVFLNYHQFFIINGIILFT